MAKKMVVYDSVFGNTRQVAIAISEGLGLGTEVAVRAVGDVTSTDLVDVELLVVGSPTRGFRATPAMMEWIMGLPADRLINVKAAAFDTRIPEAQIKENWFLRLLGPFVKYAVDPLAKTLQIRKAAGEVKKNWFFVGGTEGPLLDGELDRARQWGKELAI